MIESLITNDNVDIKSGIVSLLAALGGDLMGHFYHIVKNEGALGSGTQQQKSDYYALHKEITKEFESKQFDEVEKQFGKQVLKIRSR